MHHDNYCLRRKEHSYAVCDAALAASIGMKCYEDLTRKPTGWDFKMTNKQCSK